MSERPITFPKIREGFYRNAETGVHAFKVKGGYLPCTENRYGTSVPITSGPCATLKQARGIMTHAALRLRDANGSVYAEAVAEHVERAAVKAEQAGAPTWRAASARQMVDYATKDAGSPLWLKFAISEVARLEEWTLYLIVGAAHAEALAEAAEREVWGDPDAEPVAAEPITAYGAALDAERAEDAADLMAAAYIEAAAEDAERLVAKDGEDALIHHWSTFTDEPSDCGVDIATTPYTFGSPEWDEVTCKPCLIGRPDDAEAARDEQRWTHGDIITIEAEAHAEHHRRCGFRPGDAVVFVDPDDTGIDTHFVWRVDAVHAFGTINAYADLKGYEFPLMLSAGYFDHLAPAPRCTSREWTVEHEFVSNPAEQGGVADETICYKLRSHKDHNTDRARAESIILAARDHEGVSAGATPYGGQWPGTTVIPRVPARIDDHPAWAEYTATLPAPTPEAMAELAVEVSTWTAQRRAAVEAFRTTARTIWSLRREGLAQPGSPEYASLRTSMRTFREVIATCDRQNDALRRELTSGSL